MQENKKCERLKNAIDYFASGKADNLPEAEYKKYSEAMLALLEDPETDKMFEKKYEPMTDSAKALQKTNDLFAAAQKIQDTQGIYFNHAISMLKGLITLEEAARRTSKLIEKHGEQIIEKKYY